MKISLHFNLAEFSCKDGTAYPTQWLSDRLIPLVSDLEVIRAYLNDPILINSAYRTPSYNKKIGGALFSQHTQGTALDIKCINVKIKDLHQAILDLIKQGKIKNGGVGLYKTWVHYDHGPSRRWHG